MDIYICCQTIAGTDQEFVAGCFDNEPAAEDFCRAARTDLDYARYYYVAPLRRAYDIAEDDILIP